MRLVPQGARGQEAARRTANSGTMEVAVPPVAESPGTPKSALASALAGRMRRVTASAIMELLKSTAGRSFISFASGLPDPALFPAAELARITQDILAEDTGAALQYGPAEGHPPLREWVAGMLRRRGLVDATPEHVLITHGSQQALDLAARAFLDPADAVLLETPSYLAAIQIFDSHEARYLTVPLDSDGMNVERAGALIRKHHPRLLFTLPNFQNPTGITLSLARRQRLAEMAAEHGTPVLEDDAYHDLRYDGEPIPPLAALADNPLAVYTGTFSKTIVPALRVGYLYARPELVARLAHLKQLADLASGSFTQRIALRYCEEGLLEPQIERLRASYRARRDAMLQALQESFGGWSSWTRPQGGMFVLLSMPPEIDAAALLPQALERGVVYVPGAGFYPAGGGANTIRMTFVSTDEPTIRRGIPLLADTLKSH